MSTEDVMRVLAILESEEEDSEQRDDAVLEAELLQVDDPSLRARMVEVLWNEVLRIQASKGARPDHVLWAAVRRFASMAPVDQAERLLILLSPAEPYTTQQVALQAIQNMFADRFGQLKYDVRVRLMDAAYRIGLEIASIPKTDRDASQNALLYNAALTCAVLDDLRTKTLVASMTPESTVRFMRWLLDFHG